MDGDGFLRAMAAGLKTEIFKPVSMWGTECDGFVGISDAIAVHCAVQVYRRDAVAMRFEYAFDFSWVRDIRGAFVMNYQIVALCIIRIAEDCQGRFGAGIVGVNLSNHDVGAFLEAFLQNVFLFGVIVAAPAGNQQDS